MSDRRSAAGNTHLTYGSIERAFHWATAFLVLTAAALGLIADAMAYDTDVQLSRKALTYSLHKTVGITLFFVALGRIIWALFQPRPYPLHADRRAEDVLAATVHWMLYGSLIIVPLLGWSYHATTVGFAPILWPFGQNLPLIPKDPALGVILSKLHKLAVLCLFIALALHIFGTIKHVVIDRDQTFDRMWRGVTPDQALEPSRVPAAIPFLLAALIWGGALFYGVKTAPDLRRSETPQRPVQASAEPQDESHWIVQEGVLAIIVSQQGQGVTGTFENWTAAINFEPKPDAQGRYGTIRVEIDLGSLRLGSVTQDAKSAEFLNVNNNSTSLFEADIIRDESGEAFIADGTLALRDATIPVRLPFTLTIEEDRAIASGAVLLDRRDFGIGPSYPDENNVGYGVRVDIDLTAARGGE